MSKDQQATRTRTRQQNTRQQNKPLTRTLHNMCRQACIHIYICRARGRERAGKGGSRLSPNEKRVKGLTPYSPSKKRGGGGGYSHNMCMLAYMDIYTERWDAAEPVGVALDKILMGGIYS